MIEVKQKIFFFTLKDVVLKDFKTAAHGKSVLAVVQHCQYFIL